MSKNVKSHKAKHAKTAAKAHHNLRAKKIDKETKVGVVAGFLVILLILGSTVYWKLSSEHSLKVTPVAKKSQYTLAINNHRTSEGDRAFKPSEGSEYVIVDVQIKHMLASPLWIAPVVDSFITDASGKTYTMSPLMEINGLEARSYQPGETAAGELSYMVPKNIGDLQWCYKDVSIEKNVCLPL